MTISMVIVIYNKALRKFLLSSLLHTANIQRSLSRRGKIYLVPAKEPHTGSVSLFIKRPSAIIYNIKRKGERVEITLSLNPDSEIQKKKKLHLKEEFLALT